MRTGREHLYRFSRETLSIEDPRLNMALRVARNSLQLLDEAPKKLAIDGVMKRLQLDVARELGGDVEKLREPDRNAFAQLVPLWIPEGRLMHVFRHGEQNSSLRIQQTGTTHVPEPARKKIAMMRLPQNQTDLLTTESIAEAIAFAEGIRQLKEMSGKTLSIHAPETRRSAQFAYLLANHAGGVLNLNDELRCLDYPREIPDEQLLTMGLNPDGTIDWKQQVIDSVFGENTHTRISDSMESIIKRERDGTNDAEIYITHSQQLSAAGDKLGVSIGRLGYFGGFAVPSRPYSALHPSLKVTLLPQGLHKAA